MTATTTKGIPRDLKLYGLSERAVENALRKEEQARQKLEAQRARAKAQAEARLKVERTEVINDASRRKQFTDLINAYLEGKPDSFNFRGDPGLNRLIDAIKEFRYANNKTYTVNILKPLFTNVISNGAFKPTLPKLKLALAIMDRLKDKSAYARIPKAGEKANSPEAKALDDAFEADNEKLYNVLSNMIRRTSKIYLNDDIMKHLSDPNNKEDVDSFVNHNQYANNLLFSPKYSPETLHSQLTHKVVNETALSIASDNLLFKPSEKAGWTPTDYAEYYKELREQGLKLDKRRVREAVLRDKGEHLAELKDYVRQRLPQGVTDIADLKNISDELLLPHDVVKKIGQELLSVKHSNGQPLSEDEKNVMKARYKALTDWVESDPFTSMLARQVKRIEEEVVNDARNEQIDPEADKVIDPAEVEALADAANQVRTETLPKRFRTFSIGQPGNIRFGAGPGPALLKANGEPNEEANKVSNRVFSFRVNPLILRHSN